MVPPRRRPKPSAPARRPPPAKKGRFAQPVGSIDNLRKGNRGTGGGGGLIKFIPKDNPIVVRFLTEPKDWVKYREAWLDGRSFPVEEGMVEGRDYESGTAKFKWLANAVDVENDEVIALQINAKSLDVLVLRFDRNDTIMDRNYELVKTGTGLNDTVYDVAQQAPSKFNFNKYDLLDLDGVLSEVADRAHKSDDEDSRGGKSSTRRTQRGRPQEQEEEEEEEPLYTHKQMMDKTKVSIAELKAYAKTVGIRNPGNVRSQLVAEIKAYLEEDPF